MVTVPAEKSLHKKIIKDIVDKQKKFSSKEGDRSKFVIEFTDGYKAEYCPLVGQPWSYKIGDEATFKIRFRKEFGDEIDFIINGGQFVQNGSIQNGSATPDSKLTPFNMHGHPASLALMAAKDIRVAKLVRLDDADLKSMLKEADEIFRWLVEKA